MKDSLRLQLQRLAMRLAELHAAGGSEQRQQLAQTVSRLFLRGARRDPAGNGRR